MTLDFISIDNTHPFLGKQVIALTTHFGIRIGELCYGEVAGEEQYYIQDNNNALSQSYTVTHVALYPN
jgi:hypothetical protein